MNKQATDLMTALGLRPRKKFDVYTGIGTGAGALIGGRIGNRMGLRSAEEQITRDIKRGRWFWNTDNYIKDTNRIERVSKLTGTTAGALAGAAMGYALTNPRTRAYSGTCAGIS